MSQKVYHTYEFKIFVHLSQSFMRLNIDPKQGFQIVYSSCYNEFRELSKNFEYKNYCKLLKLVQLKISSFAVTKSIVKTNNSRMLNDTHILFSMNPAKLWNKGLKDKGMTSFYINSYFDINFIRAQRRYNKRRYARVRSVSRPSFWAGSLISCLLVGMFWGASFQFSDWLFTQVIIIDVNIILVFIYIYVLYFYLEVYAHKKGIRVRLVQKIWINQFLFLLRYYLKLMKW